jgi:hypothetical protein
MPPLHLRQEFPTLKAFKEALHAWAIEDHFEPRILKSDTGRVRVGCKRDPNCPFVIRCNWERKGGREPLARVTVMKEKHTCLNGVWMNAAAQQGAMLVTAPQDGSAGDSAGNGLGALSTVDIRQDEDDNIVGGARVLGPMEGGGGAGRPRMVPVLPKVQRNSASRLPFLMEKLPRLMRITKDTTPGDIQECMLSEYGAEVHLQQCRRAKTEILKKMAAQQEERTEQGPPPDIRPPQQQGLDGMGNEGANDGQQAFREMNATPNQSSHAFPLHAAAGIVTPVMPNGSAVAPRTVGEAPVRCPYCINHRWMKSIKDAVEHMSMHVVV